MERMIPEYTHDHFPGTAGTEAGEGKAAGPRPMADRHASGLRATSSAATAMAR